MNFLDERLPDRFWAKVTPCPMSGCWLWFGAWQKHGHGQTCHQNRVVYAHRRAYEALVGPIPEGLQIDHLCRVRCCVNPAHLEPVTARENTLRGESISVRYARRSACPNGHPYSGDNLYVKPDGSRACRACRREQWGAWAHRTGHRSAS